MVRAGADAVWLEKRPASGVWGGLWCFPEIAAPADSARWCLDRWGLEPRWIQTWEPFRHTFSHYHLEIQPVLATLAGPPGAVMEDDRQLWYNRRQPQAVGLAAPVADLLARL